MKIMVVEDNPKHLQDAVRVLKAAGVDVVTAISFAGIWSKDGVKMFDIVGGETNSELRYPPLVDGVITDIYLPRGHGSPEKFAHSDFAYGLHVAAKARRSGIPFVFCTDGYHHAAQFQWVDDLIELLGWPQMVDELTRDGEKNWGEALKRLQHEIESRRQS